MRRTIVYLVLGCISGFGCDQETVDATGDYTLALTNRGNECGFDNWTEGDTSSGVGMTIAQDGESATATVDGVAALLLDLLQGGHVFAGEVEGDALNLQIFGGNQRNENGCPHVINSTLSATLDGDVLVGRLTYTADGNGSPECESLQGCESIQEFNGTRPPR